MIKDNISTNDREADTPPESPDERIVRRANQYALTLQTREQEQTDATRAALFDELSVYRQYLTTEESPNEPMEVWSPLQRKIHYASIYAQSYLEQKTPAETVRLVRRDLCEEGHSLPKGIAEWIVHHVEAESKNQQEKVDELKIGLTDFAGEVAKEQIDLDSTILAANNEQ